MKLYKVKASDFETVFGSPVPPEELKRGDLIRLAQTPNCDAFLFLAKDTYVAEDKVELLDSVPTGYDFTYCQEWGLTVDDDVVDRVIIDLEK